MTQRGAAQSGALTRAPVLAPAPAHTPAPPRGWLALVLGLLLAAAGPALAGFDDGMAAARRGNYRAAFEIWLPLAQEGDVRAQYNLGVLYDKGFGAPQNYAEAARWYLAAAERGDIAAQANLGALHANGWGVARDDVLAHMWLNLAVSGTESRKFRRSLIRKRDRVAGRLTPERIAEAQRLAQDWRPK